MGWDRKDFEVFCSPGLVVVGLGHQLYCGCVATCFSLSAMVKNSLPLLFSPTCYAPVVVSGMEYVKYTLISLHFPGILNLSPGCFGNG